MDSVAGYAFDRQRRFAEAKSSFKAAEPVFGHRSRGLAWVLALDGKQAEARAIPMRSSAAAEPRTSYLR
jgi:hypothetical protein